MRSICFCFLLILCLSLSSAARFKFADDRIYSPNGLYRTRQTRDTLKFYRGDKLLWQRSQRWDVNVLDVSDQGRVLTRDFNEGLCLFDRQGRILSHPKDELVQSAWFSLDGRQVVMESASQRLEILEEESAVARPITAAEFSRECSNPRAPIQAMLTHAACSGCLLPDRLLPAWHQDKTFHWQLLGLLARQNPRLRRALPHQPHLGQEADWLRALATARPELVDGELSRLRRLPQHMRLFTDACCDLTETQPEQGQKYLLGMLKSPRPAGERAELLRILALDPDPRLNPIFADHTRDQPDEVVKSAIDALVARNQLADLRPLLGQSVGRWRILRHLARVPDPESLVPLGRLLDENDETTLHLTMDALRYQYRLDLGHDRQAWRRWIQQQRPGQNRLDWLPKNHLTGLLAAAWQGRLQPQDLAGVPRLTRVIQQEDRAPYEIEIDERGELMLEYLNPPRLTDLVSGRVVEIKAGAGLHGADCKCSIDLTHRRCLVNQNNRLEVQEFPGGRRLQSLKNDSWPDLRAGHASLIHLRAGLWDLSRQQLAHPLPSPYLQALSPTEPCCILDYQRPYLYDFGQGRKVRELSPHGSHRFSQDGRSVLTTAIGELAIRNLDGSLRGRLKPWHGLGDVSRDAEWAAQLLDDEIQLTRVAEAHITRLKAPSALSCHFSPTGSQLLVVYPEMVTVHRLPDLQQVAQWPVSGWSWQEYGQAPRWRGSKIIGEFGTSNRIFDLKPCSITAPAEHQRLLSELWTGVRLQAGLPVLLTGPEYQARCQRWRQLGGGDWCTRPMSLLPEQDESKWLVAFSLLALTALLAGWWKLGSAAAGGVKPHSS